MALVTCHTDGCECSGSSVDLDITFVDPNTGETCTADAVLCGACAQQITDIQGD